MDSQTHHRLVSGVAPILGASLLWAVGYYIRKTIIDDVSAIPLAFFNALLTAWALWVFYRMRPARVWRVFRSHAGLFVILALSGVVFGSSLMFLSLDYIDLGAATTLEKLQPVFTLAMAWFLLNERLAARQLVYAAAMMIASVMVVSEDPFRIAIGRGNAIGLAAVVGAAFCWAIASVVGKLLLSRNVDPPMVTFMRFALGSLFLSPFLVFHRQLDLTLRLDASIAGLIAASALVSSTLGYILYYRGLRYVTAGVAGLLELVTPLAGILLGIAFLGERLNPVQAAAVAVMLFSVYRISIDRPS